MCQDQIASSCQLLSFSSPPFPGDCSCSTTPSSSLHARLSELSFSPFLQVYLHQSLAHVRPVRRDIPPSSFFLDGRAKMPSLLIKNLGVFRRVSRKTVKTVAAVLVDWLSTMHLKTSTSCGCGCWSFHEIDGALELSLPNICVSSCPSPMSTKSTRDVGFILPTLHLLFLFGNTTIHIIIARCYPSPFRLSHFRSQPLWNAREHVFSSPLCRCNRRLLSSLATSRLFLRHLPHTLQQPLAFASMTRARRSSL